MKATKVHQLAQWDRRYVWHPFTQMADWLKRQPIIVESGQGALLRDVRGREYLDGNSSIWTNLHGHRSIPLNRALKRQLEKIAHSSFLGLSNVPATLLAKELVTRANARPAETARGRGKAEPGPALAKVFFSDDGSTAMEVALKLAYEYARRTGRSKSPRFLSLSQAYHGDTVGAASLGHIPLFQKRFSGLLFKSDEVMAPYCYRCPFNRARPERADARSYRKCQFECADLVEKKFKAQKKKGEPYAAMVVEPLIQGAAGMIPQPPGWLRRVGEIVRDAGAQLIVDEVLTGFGRTGTVAGLAKRGDGLFGFQQEGVRPDLMALGKGLTGGYLPMAATLTSQTVFDAFLGDYAEFKTFFHGHSYTGNQLGSAAALASLALLDAPGAAEKRHRLAATLGANLEKLWVRRAVGDIRQAGLMAGIELVKDWRTREPFAAQEQAGIRVCRAMARRGVLTRPVGNVVVLMPPYCATPAQVGKMAGALHDSIEEVLG